MSLFLATSGSAPIPDNIARLTKGELYNLDLNESLGFQFNPERLRTDKNFEWLDVAWLGSKDGGDLQYKGSGPTTFDLDLRFVALPGAPRIQSDAGERVSPSDDLPMDFEAIEETLRRWSQDVEGKRRPSRIKVILGERAFNCVITRIGSEVTAFFEDLTAREAILTIGFRQWELTK